MKKLILSLFCIGGMLLLPGCWCRKECVVPCDDYYDECYDDCHDTCHDDCEHHDHDCDDSCNDSKEIIGYEEQQGYRRNLYRKKNVAVMPQQKIMHTPVHPEVIETAQRQGKKIKYLDPRFEKHNAQMVADAEALEQVKQPKASLKKVASNR